ncbi:MAG: peptide chain release factor N(5)-glutamine methyltransferase [bacterium]|nr:peptide chain release factor N(5)-glutamine methyltransferase [bacterium]
MKTVKEFLEVSTDYLAKKLEIPKTSARKEIELLLAAILQCNRLQVYLRFDQPLKRDEIEQFRTMLQRRASHEPIQWIIGSIEFCGNRFNIPRNVFIPRPETEEWVDWLIQLPIQLFPNQIPPKRILEIGVGSGVIICSLLRKWKEAFGIGIDISEVAIQTTLENATELNVGDRIQLFQIKAGSFQRANTEKPFDLVVSNPPYIRLNEFNSLSKEVLFEPKEALLGGEDGLDAYRTFQKRLPQWAAKGSVYVFEIGIHQQEGIQKILEPISSQIFFRKDLSGIPRVVYGTVQ